MLLYGRKERKTMFDKFFKIFFERKNSRSITTISRCNREIKIEGLKEKTLTSSGIYRDFSFRETFYQRMFNAYSQQEF